MGVQVSITLATPQLVSKYTMHSPRPINGEVSCSDAAGPTVITTSRYPTYAKSSWTPKVNPFLYASLLPTLLNGMLLHTPSHIHDRFTPTSTEATEEDRNIKPDKTEAWKRRWKKAGACGT